MAGDNASSWLGAPARVLRGLALGLLTTASACGGYRFIQPTGAGEPAPDGDAAWAEAMTGCRAIRNASSTLTLTSLSVAGHGYPRLVVFTGATSDGGIYLEARYNGSAVFKFGGTAERATLLLIDDNQTVTARADEILESFVGLKVGPARWLALLTGCVSTTGSFVSAKQFGVKQSVTSSDSVVVLERIANTWRATGGVFDDLSIGYVNRGPDWPNHWVLASVPGAREDVRLEATSNDPHVNDATVTTAGFVAAVQPPPSAVTITLADLRASGPLRRKR